MTIRRHAFVTVMVTLILMATTSRAFTLNGKVGRIPLMATTRVKMSEDGGGDGWTGDVVSNNKGSILTGCKITPVEGSLTEWIVDIDGVEADLAKFSVVVYKKITADAKTQAFQGFRPGTIPPHLLRTYRAFTMDEVCRETTLEAMQQNNIRPFDDARENFEFIKFSIPPPKQKKKKKKKTKKKKKQTDGEEVDDAPPPEEPELEPEWLSFETMKEALDGGWQPGTSFSFQATCVNGQKLAEDAGANPMINPLTGR